MTQFSYVGTELDLFAAAYHWKSYLAHSIRPHVGRRVLEVGAGLGATTRVLCAPTVERWVCLEPDPHMHAFLIAQIASGHLPKSCEAIADTVDSGALAGSFDTVLYVDVLEHIADDRQELVLAAKRLLPNGFLVVFGPAHSWLYSPFDKAIGHYRRYDKRMLRKLTPPGTALRRLIYLDSVGVLLSLANKVILKQAQPNAQQIATWDRAVVPLSRVIDPVLRHAIGKSIMAVWQKVRD